MKRRELLGSAGATATLALVGTSAAAGCCCGRNCPCENVCPYCAECDDGGDEPVFD